MQKCFLNSWTESFICDFYQTATAESQVATTTRRCSLLQTRTHFQREGRGEDPAADLIRQWRAVGLSAHLIATRGGLPSASSWPHPHSLHSHHCHIYSHRARICLLLHLPAQWCFIMKTPFPIHFRKFSHVYMKSLQYLRNWSLLQTACFFMSAQCSLLTIMF